MKGLIFLILLSNAQLGIAQYSYFSNLYEPPDFENNNSSSLWNLFVVDTNLWCIGAAYVDTSYRHLMLNVDDETGQVIAEHFIPYSSIEPYYAWCDTYTQSENGDFVGVYEVSGTTPNSTSIFAFELNQTGEVNWSTTTEFASDSTNEGSLLIIRLNDGSYLSCGRTFHQSDSIFQAIGLLLLRYFDNGNHLFDVEIPLWNEEWQSIFPHEQIFPTDMIELDNGEILISGVWGDELPQPFKRRPFFMKLTSELDVISGYDFGNPDVDNWYPWMHKLEDGNVVFAYAHGAQWNEDFPTYADFDMRMGLFDPVTMDTLFVKTYPHQGLSQMLQDFEPTPDGGFIMLA